MLKRIRPPIEDDLELVAFCGEVLEDDVKVAQEEGLVPRHDAEVLGHWVTSRAGVS